MTSHHHHPGLTFATFRPRDPGGVTPERVDGWFEAQSRGFHQGRVSEEMRRQFLEHLAVDDALLRGVWPDQSALGSGTIPVATFASFDKTLNVGDRLLPLRMITDVTVSPTHRRQGLLRTLMVEDLGDAADRGLPLAALTVSEGSIYGRFGFGLAAHQRQLEVDTTTRFALRALDDDGRMELLEPVEAWPTVAAVFDRFHRRTRGSVDRPQFYEPMLTGTFAGDDGPDRKLRTAVHLDADGEPDGYVVFRHEGRQEGRPTIAVKDLVGLTRSSYLRIWRFLADIDLAERVTWGRSPVADPLAWALVDPFAARVVKLSDSLWVRVLDPVTALEARAWGADGEVVLEVADSLGHAAGRLRVTSRDGRAVVTRTDADAGILLDAETLGSLYLGGVGVATLRSAGRLTGDDRSLGDWAAMVDIGPAPYCITGF